MTNEIESGQELNVTQLDAQRARTLLDRALGMSERNDMAAAIVACRKSLALAPNSSQGWSMLGLLSERDSDLHGAIEAYEKALQLSPGSILERESLQRLRQQRGYAPRPAPKFNFDDSVEQEPPALPEEIQLNPLPEPFLSGLSSESRNTFYFRSLPLLITIVACIGFILVAQRVATNRRIVDIQNTRVTPAVAATGISAVPASPTRTNPQNLSSGALAPPVQPDQPVSPETPVTEAPAPITPSKRAPAPKPKPHIKPTTKAPAPFTMPVLPPPRLTLPPSRTASPSTNSDAGDSSSAGNTDSSGPVDVGGSESSRYIPIAPPHFPNPRRNR